MKANEIDTLGKHFPPSQADPQRRALLAGLAGFGGLAAAGLGLPAWAQQPAASASGTRIILVGTKGGPRVGGERSNPCTALLIDGVPYVIDCGQGVARQLVQAGISLRDLRYVFLTHMHSDHNLEYGGLLYSAWATGLKDKVAVYGPPPLEEMTQAFFEYMKFDIDTRIGDEGKPDPRKLVETHTYDRDGVILQNAQVKVSAARNIHPPIHHSYGLRFDTRDRSVVVSGDTNYSEAIVKLATGADVLVHEAIYVPGVDAMLKRVPNAATLREHLLASHTTTEDVGRVAAEAGVKKLVLTHLVPGDDPGITDEMWLEGVRKHYKGEVVVGKDLMVL
ncbi:MBL fold metallo-hydrolase [Azoarcus indigens]|uniref:Ribonuclease BN (tRNA processing enzyme) n=1 Tax=Azoarcus indigens TaxID=29545 RepID=A0A4R6DZL8_9RHOO|nr:MBL fold metallo-hydrolase [Azoarcus indigens]NMG64775.1 MBL fold metallo-hydrolase [Azoarcus indigens]TDN50840.1 ribonuclease BN (tRNA processing enzyme) [Azoarcus indigens]